MWTNGIAYMTSIVYDSIVIQVYNMYQAYALCKEKW